MPEKKVIATLLGGAVVVSETAGVVTIEASDAASVGGGAAAGLVKVEGSAKITLDAMSGLKLGEALLNAHLPAGVSPLAAVVEAVVNQAVSAVI